MKEEISESDIHPRRNRSGIGCLQECAAAKMDVLRHCSMCDWFLGFSGHEGHLGYPVQWGLAKYPSNVLRDTINNFLHDSHTSSM